MDNKEFKEFIDKTKEEMDAIFIEAQEASKRFDDNYIEIISRL